MGSNYCFRVLFVERSRDAAHASLRVNAFVPHNFVWSRRGWRLRESTVLVHTYLPTLKTNPLYTSVEMCKMGFLAKLPDNPLYTKLSPDNSLYTPTLHINIIIVVAAKKPSTPCTPFFNMLTPTLNSLCSPPPPVCGAT